VISNEKYDLGTWHHLLIMYSDSFCSFYADGVLQRKVIKNFETKFLANDSVIIGASTSQKNLRFTEGAIDDLVFYDRLLSEQEISDLHHAPNPNKTKIIINRVLLLIAILAAIALIYLFIKFRHGLVIKKQKERLELYNIILGTELRVNRALMNPHFVFNSMNTLHNFILANENDDASSYLIKFSKLIRKILEGNTQDHISLELEIELLEGYLEIENLRFEEQIAYTVTSTVHFAASSIHIPIMMLQPFVENAIWHGLLDKPGEKTIAITFSAYKEKYICCVIEDNGIGRKAAEGSSKVKKSMATNFVIQRLDLFNRLLNLDCRLDIEDKPEGSGTVVTILLPILNK
jgi:sensor histidine kinase YesM